jgi:hypothetical protein
MPRSSVSYPLGDSRPVKSNFRATSSGPRGSDWFLFSAKPLPSDKSGEIFFLGDGRSISLQLQVGVPGSFEEVWHPRVRQTVGGSSASESDSWSDGGVGECWCFLDCAESRCGVVPEAGAGGLESM